MKTNFFERELRRFFEDGETIPSPTFSGRACFGTLDGGLRVRAEFITTGVYRQYEALRVTIFHRTDGEVDHLTFRFQDIWGKKFIPDNPTFRDGVVPCIAEDYEGVYWHGCQPGAADVRNLLQHIRDYLEVFQNRERPRVVYLCVPFQDNAEKSMTLARQKAREVMDAGNLPVSPLFLLPPDVSLDDPAQTKEAQEIGRTLLKSCQELCVCTPEEDVTREMLVEIHLAQDQGIPVRTKEDMAEMNRGPKHAKAHGVAGRATPRKRTARNRTR